MPELTIPRHIKYYLRCLKTFLPSLYTSADSNRILLAFFTLSGLDVLDVLHSETTPEERHGYIEWIYHCQVPTGGFRGFTGTDFSAQQDRTPANACWDPASIPSTFFALVILVILGDDLARVKREECLSWLPCLQRSDGSFGDLLGAEGQIEGGRDLRFCCFAAGTRYLLRGPQGRGVENVRDIDVGQLVAFIEACQTYDGGMSEAPFCESHSGLTYCAIGALDFLDRLNTSSAKISPLLSPGTPEFEALVRWLVERQTAELETGPNDTTSEIRTVEDLPALEPPSDEALHYAGFNGRSNKIADTCYSFWNTATLAVSYLLQPVPSRDDHANQQMLDRLSLVDAVRNRQYLLDKTQHLVGGFGKGVGEPPDLLHSYFGLVSLAFHNESGLTSVDPTLCTTHRGVRHLHSLPWW